jgi:hypothetical protein
MCRLIAVQSPQGSVFIGLREKEPEAFFDQSPEQACRVLGRHTGAVCESGKEADAVREGVCEVATRDRGLT